jgi:hypothetical protein
VAVGEPTDLQLEPRLIVSVFLHIGSRLLLGQVHGRLDIFFVNPLRTKLYPSDLNTQLVPRSKHSASHTKTSQITLYREIIAVCSQIRTKHISTVWAERRICEPFKEESVSV